MSVPTYAAHARRGAIRQNVGRAGVEDDCCGCMNRDPYKPPPEVGDRLSQRGPKTDQGDRHENQ
jgi:hypothetical protein